MIDHSLDDHMEEHLADKANKEAAAQAAKESEQAIDHLHYQAERDNENFDRIRREAGTLVEIAAAMRMQTRLPVEHVQAEGKILCGDIDVSWNMEIKAEWTKDTWRSKPTGKTRITVGDYGNRTSYPQRKDGTHNYVDIARALVGYAEKKIKEAAMALAIKNNSVDVEALRKDIGLENYGAMTVRPSTLAEVPVFVSVDIKQAMTTDQARRLAAALRSVDLIKEKKT